MKNCYVLFVKTGCENKIVKQLNPRLDSSLYLPFVPTEEKFFRRKGNTKKETELCFPGYIFVKSEVLPDEFIVELLSFIRTYNEIYKIVSYGDKNDIVMRENEKLLLKKLFGNDYCIKGSVGFIEGDKIRIQDGPLKGMEKVIKKLIATKEKH